MSDIEDDLPELPEMLDPEEGPDDSMEIPDIAPVAPSQDWAAVEPGSGPTELDWSPPESERPTELDSQEHYDTLPDAPSQDWEAMEPLSDAEPELAEPELTEPELAEPELPEPIPQQGAGNVPAEPGAAEPDWEPAEPDAVEPEPVSPELPDTELQGAEPEPPPPHSDYDTLSDALMGGEVEADAPEWAAVELEADEPTPHSDYDTLSDAPMGGELLDLLDDDQPIPEPAESPPAERVHERAAGRRRARRERMGIEPQELGDQFPVMPDTAPQADRDTASVLRDDDLPDVGGHDDLHGLLAEIASRLTAIEDALTSGMGYDL